jgi:hypothetical protein
MCIQNFAAISQNGVEILQTKSYNYLILTPKIDTKFLLKKFGELFKYLVKNYRHFWQKFLLNSFKEKKASPNPLP